jgi:hypothetical protein
MDLFINVSVKKQNSLLAISGPLVILLWHTLLFGACGGAVG